MKNTVDTIMENIELALTDKDFDVLEKGLSEIFPKDLDASLRECIYDIYDKELYKTIEKLNKWLKERQKSRNKS